MDAKNNFKLLALKEKLTKQEIEKKTYKPELSEFDKKIKFIINKLKSPDICKKLRVTKVVTVRSELEIHHRYWGIITINTIEIADEWIEAINL